MFGRKGPITKGAHLKEHTAGTSNELSFDVLDAARRQLDDKNFDPNAVKVKTPRKGVGMISLLFSKVHFTKESIGNGQTKAKSGSPTTANTSEAKDPKTSTLFPGKRVKTEDIPKRNSAAAEQRQSRKAARAEARALAKRQKRERYDSKHSLSRAANAAPYSNESAQVEVKRRKKIRHRRRVRLAVTVAVACVVAAGLAGNYAYQRYRLYNDQSELINHAVEEIVSADESVVQLDSLIGDPMAEIKNDTWKELEKNLPAAESHLDSARDTSNDLLPVLGEGDMQIVTGQIIDACDARQVMIDSGKSIFEAAEEANGTSDSVAQIWADVLQADSVARDGVALLSAGSLDDSMASAKEKLHEAASSFQNAWYELQQLENANANLDLSKLTEYLDKRLEALDYASATAQALLDRNKSEATSQAKLYNEADSAAVKLAAALPTDLSEPVKAAFEKDIEDLRKKYDDARYAASAADDRIRDYLGA